MTFFAHSCIADFFKQFSLAPLGFSGETKMHSKFHAFGNFLPGLRELPVPAVFFRMLERYCETTIILRLQP